MPLAQERLDEAPVRRRVAARPVADRPNAMGLIHARVHDRPEMSYPQS